MKRMEGKVAMITGGHSGIGKATAELFAREGANLVLAARRYDLLQEESEICKAIGADVYPIQADVTNYEDCVRLADEAAKHFGKIDVLVNNAGIADKHRPITRTAKEWWDNVIAIDQSSLFYLTKEVLRYMEPAGAGSIINISSIGGVFGNSGISYSAAKAAVIGMTKNIAIQFAGKGIRCNAVCPGPTPTALNTPEQIATFDQEFAQICGKHMDLSLPEASAEDQANAILFFACEESKAVTGQVLIVDHGSTL